MALHIDPTGSLPTVAYVLEPHATQSLMKETIISKQDEFCVASVTILFESSTSQFNFWHLATSTIRGCNFSRLYNMAYDSQLPFISSSQTIQKRDQVTQVP